MFDSARFNGFVKNKLDDLLFTDIWDYWVFNESDLHSAAYYYIRKYFEQRASDNAFVRCEPPLRGMRPDIVVFDGIKPTYVIELKMFPEPERINESAVDTDLSKLQEMVSLDTVKWGFLLVVYDSDELWGVSDASLRRQGYSKISVIDLSMRRQEKSGRKRHGYDTWRHEFDRLRDNQGRR